MPRNLGKVLTEIDGHKTMNALNKDGYVTLDVAGTPLTLTKDDLLIETIQTEGYAVASEYDLFVALDTTLTEELIEEGYVNELVSKVQTMRKDAGFEVVDHINLQIANNDLIKTIVEKNKKDIQRQLLADVLTYDEILDGSFEKEWNLNGEDVTLAVKKL